jgi:hypothetical protein
MVPILNATYETVNSFLKPSVDHESDAAKIIDSALNIEKLYCEIMKNFQFGK